MQHEFSKVSVIGLGYIGLPTAAILASRGIEVVGVDINKHAVDVINRGQVHIVEPDLDIIVRGAVNAGKFRATTVPEPADAFLIAVPTPFKEGYKPDLSYIESGARAIAPVLKSGDLVVLESTSPVGATEQMARWMAEERPDLTFPHQAAEKADVMVAHCPERVLPGRVLLELVENDRTVGGMTARCADRAAKLYKTFVAGECVLTDCRTAEMVKLTENSFRDVNIAFANELSIICEKLDINVWELIRLANRHPRVKILNPGPGVGGHCIAVDPWFIVDSAPEEAKLIRTARQVNDSKPDHVLNKVRKAVAQLKQPKIACLGLAFKADIDDLRESPAMDIVERIAEEKLGEVYAVEPNISALPESLLNRNIGLVPLEHALQVANALVVLVDHRQFKKIPPNALEGKLVIDTRGIIW